MLVGVLGRARAARVDDDDLAAALADRAQPAADVGRRHQRAVGGQRVGARASAGAACGRGPGPGSSAARRTSARRDVLGHLVDRRGREDVLACRAPCEHAAVELRRRGCGRTGCRRRRRRRRGRGPRGSAAAAGRSRRTPRPRSPRRSSPSRPRTSGVRRRSGSWCRAPSEPPFGQMKPCEKTSASSPRTRRPPRRRRRDLEAAGGLAQRAGPVRGALLHGRSLEGLTPPGCRREPGASAARRPQAPWHFLNFLPDPHQQGSLRPSCSLWPRSLRWATGAAP